MSTQEKSRSKRAKHTPRHEVISLRLNTDRLNLLKRSQKALSDQLGRPVSLAEAAFLVFEQRAVEQDRQASRFELLQAPTASLEAIRAQWESQHTLSAAQWDVLAEYVLAGAEEGRQEPPAALPAIPSRESYLALLDAFEAVYQHRRRSASPHVWSYFGNLDGYQTTTPLSATDAGQRDQALVDHVARQRRILQNPDRWHAPGHVGRCFQPAVLQEDVASTELDHLLAVYWPTLWGLAARGHWVRHHQPVRPADRPAPQPLQGSLPGPLTAGEFTVSFTPLRDPEFTTHINFGSTRRFTAIVHRYPELVELRALFTRADRLAWSGTYFRTFRPVDEVSPITTLWLKRQEVSVDLSDGEWQALGELLERAWQHPQLQRLLRELRLQYGEQGSDGHAA